MITKDFKYKIIKKEPIENLINYKNHRRLKVFYEKGIYCHNKDCNFVATFIGIGIKNGAQHIDLYNEDLRALTVDHINPISKSKDDSLSNKQPLCYKCNKLKSDKLPNNFHLYEERKDINILKNLNLKRLSVNDNINQKTNIYKPVNKKKSNFKFLGIFSKFKMNPHTNKISVMVRNNEISMYNFNSVYIEC